VGKKKKKLVSWPPGFEAVISLFLFCGLISVPCKQLIFIVIYFEFSCPLFFKLPSQSMGKLRVPIYGIFRKHPYVPDSPLNSLWLLTFPHSCPAIYVYECSWDVFHIKRSLTAASRLYCKRLSLITDLSLVPILQFCDNQPSGQCQELSKFCHQVNEFCHKL
jgi:hypothetical protein